jgi:hypothetical protein
MLSVKAIYKEGRFIPEDRSFPQGENKHVIIIFPDEDSQNENNISRKSFVGKWRGTLESTDVNLADEKEERREYLRKKHK